MNTSLKVTLVVGLILGLAVCAVADPLVVTGLDPTAANAMAMAQALAGAGITVDSASKSGSRDQVRFSRELLRAARRSYRSILEFS